MGWGTQRDYETHLAPYATRSEAGGRRVHAEPPDPLRSPFELDRHRIMESTAFRRMEGKTQVFAATAHDHFRTRLTHTLEVADVARCLARALGANEYLAEAISLAHDLGHPPFGHAGEIALNEAMRECGGFDHNAHSLRVVEHLEHPFPPFRGLNLTHATLAGLRAHETRYDRPSDHADHGTGSNSEGGHAEGGHSVGGHPEGVGTEGTIGSRVGKDASGRDSSSIEAQIASHADRVAYDLHDLEDALGAGLVRREDLTAVSLWRDAAHVAPSDDSDANVLAVRRLVLNEMLRIVLMDVVRTARMRLEERTDDVVLPSAAVESKLEELERFLIERVYQHPDTARMDELGRDMVLALFDAYRKAPDALPERFLRRIDDQGRERVICDYVAGMTDRFCRREHDRLVMRPR